MIDASFVEKIEQLITDVNPIAVDADGKQYIKTGWEEKFIPTYQNTIHCNFLTGVLEFLKSDIAGKSLKELYVLVSGFAMVHVNSKINPEDRNDEVILEASINTFNFRYGNQYTKEEMIVKLQSQFEETPDREKLLEILSNVVDEDIIESNDNGLHQRVTVKKGLAKVGSEDIPKNVTLTPKRTFPEILQPTGTFLLRAHDFDSWALYELDESVWKLNTKVLIKEWLDEAGLDVPVIL